MADTMRYTTLLPAIKCSDCGVELEISMMGDHVCDTDAEEPVSMPHTQDIAPPPSLPPPQPRSSPEYTRPIIQKPAAIDVGAANRLDISSSSLTPLSSASHPKSASPRIMNKDRPMEFRMPPRSATLPVPRPPTPPSPQLQHGQDSAFPLFPLGRSRTGPDATTKSNTALGSPALNPPEEYTRPPFNPPPPPSPKTATSGSKILKRMNSMARGPFSKPRKNQSISLKDAQQIVDGHQRTESAASIYDDNEQSARNEPTIVNMSSPAFPPEPRTPSPFDKSDGFARVDRDGRPLPSGPPPPRPVRPEGIDDFLDHLQHDSAQDPIRSAGFQTRAPVTAEAAATTPELDEQQNRPGHGTKLSTSFSTSSLARSPERSHSRSRSRSSSTPRQRSPPTSTQQVPETQAYDVGNPYHAPSESASSIGSNSGIGTRTASSRSSPPTSNASSFSQRLKTQGHNDIPEAISEVSIDESYDEDGPAQSSARDPLTPISPVAQGNKLSNVRYPAANFSRPRAPEPAVIPPSMANRQPPTPLESPIDPHMQTHNAYFPLSTGGRIAETSSPSPVNADAYPPPPPIPASPAKAHGRGTNSSKGHCRGCTLPITGKCVKAADGRLTGRYHKECFVCTTCKEPFQTADFYVITNNPYCAHHYHMLNNSLCTRCDSGIEGEYLETVDRKRFHSGCFTCQECRQPLPQDYFDINGRSYCEEDALRIHNRNNRLGPGRRFPERRTTKLMMM